MQIDHTNIENISQSMPENFCEGFEDEIFSSYRDNNENNLNLSGVANIIKRKLDESNGDNGRNDDLGDFENKGNKIGHYEDHNNNKRNKRCATESIYWLRQSFKQTKLKIQASLSNAEILSMENESSVDRPLAFGLGYFEGQNQSNEEVHKDVQIFCKKFNDLYKVMALDNQDSKGTFGSLQFICQLYKAWDYKKNCVKIVEHNELTLCYKKYDRCLQDIYIQMCNLNLKNKDTTRGHPHTYLNEWIRMSRMIFGAYCCLCALYMYECDRSLSSDQRWTLANVEELLNFTGDNLSRNIKLKKQNNFRIVFEMCLRRVKQLKLIRRKDWFTERKAVL